MKKALLIFITTLLAASCIEAKISFGTFMKKGLLTAIKENNERNKLKDAVKEVESPDVSENEEEDLDPDDVRNFFKSIDDTQYQWTQGKSKGQQALMSTNGLVISNKIEKEIYASTVELPVVVDTDDFIFGIVTSSTKLNENNGIVLIFDYQDDHNFKAIVINDSQYRYLKFSNGVANSVKTGLIKYSNKNTLNTIYIQREGSTIYFYLNDVEYGVLKNVVINNAVFGAGVMGKASTTILKMIFHVDIPENDIEQSTTGD